MIFHQGKDGMCVEHFLQRKNAESSSVFVRRGNPARKASFPRIEVDEDPCSRHRRKPAPQELAFLSIFEDQNSNRIQECLCSHPSPLTPHFHEHHLPVLNGSTCPTCGEDRVDQKQGWLGDDSNEF